MRDVGLKVVCVFLLLGVVCLNIPSVSKAKFNMSYLYGNYDYISLVERTNGALNEISPSYFDLNEDGTLHLNDVDSNLINKMHEKGITVVPFLSNHWEKSKGRAALSNRVTLVNQIVNAIKKYNLDGINVDLENLSEADKSNYVELVKLLKEKLPSGKSVSVAVAANPYGWNTGWHGSYDYKQLGNYADYIMLMAYDEHYEGGEAGPVAGINFVEDSIKYALKYVSKDKIVLGIPFYGRYWQNGASYGGYGVTINKIKDILKKYSSKVYYDEYSQSVKATVTIQSSEICPVINGKALKAGTYTFWYENEQSITKKLELVNKYDLKGSGSWSLGQENAEIWNFYGKVVNGDDEENRSDSKFYDVSSSYWAYDAISIAKENGWVDGRSKYMFEPEGLLTRAEFATILSRILGYSNKIEGEYFLDCEKHWAHDAINSLTQAHLLNGYGNGLFLPDNLISREEVAKVLYYLTEDVEIGAYIDFKDVAKDRWSYEYIHKLGELGILKGYENGEYKPENAIKRSEIVSILARIFA